VELVLNLSIIISKYGPQPGAASSKRPTLDPSQYKNLLTLWLQSASRCQVPSVSTAVTHSYLNPLLLAMSTLSGESRNFLKNAECSLRRTEWTWNSCSKTVKQTSGLETPGCLNTMGGLDPSVFCFLAGGGTAILGAVSENPNMSIWPDHRRKDCVGPRSLLGMRRMRCVVVKGRLRDEDVLLSLLKVRVGKRRTKSTLQFFSSIYSKVKS
jgi:hypothetical protein